jgi:hypothetical protein
MCLVRSHNDLSSLYGFMPCHIVANLVNTVMEGYGWSIMKNNVGILYEITVVIMSASSYNSTADWGGGGTTD